MQSIFGRLSIEGLTSRLYPQNAVLLMTGFPDPHQAARAATNYIVNVKGMRGWSCGRDGHFHLRRYLTHNAHGADCPLRPRVHPPSFVSPSSLDILNEEMQVSYEMTNLQLLLEELCRIVLL